MSPRPSIVTKDGKARPATAKKNPIEGKQHVDVLFFDEEVDEIDRDRVRLRATSRADVVRTGRRVLHGLVLNSEASDILIITDAEGKIRYRIPIDALLG